MEEKQSTVTVKWKEVADVVIEIDPDALTWDHLMQFTEIEAKNKAGTLTEVETLKAMTDILGAVTGLDINKTSARVVNELLSQLKKLMGPDEEVKN